MNLINPKKVKNKNFIEKKNRHLLKNVKKIIFPYSDINSTAKRPPEYSTLNPETSSDSPSEKSKGVRFISAKIITNHNIIRFQSPAPNITPSWVFKISKK